MFLWEYIILRDILLENGNDWVLLFIFFIWVSFYRRSFVFSYDCSMFRRWSVCGRRGAVPRKAGWAPRKNREVTMDYRFVKFQGTFPEKQQTRLIPICIRHTPAQLILYVDSKKNWKATGQLCLVRHKSVRLCGIDFLPCPNASILWAPAGTVI